jgi:hypothetical protein
MSEDVTRQGYISRPRPRPSLGSTKDANSDGERYPSGKRWPSLNTMNKLTHFKENRDEPEPLSKSERSERLVVRGSGLRHGGKQTALSVWLREICFLIYLCRVFCGPLFPGPLGLCVGR